jgi:hypothetical protein
MGGFISRVEVSKWGQSATLQRAGCPGARPDTEPGRIYHHFKPLIPALAAAQAFAYVPDFAQRSGAVTSHGLGKSGCFVCSGAKTGERYAKDMQKIRKR